MPVSDLAPDAACAAPEPVLSHEEKRRYARHLVLPQFGPGEQAKLKAARVLAVGAGGLSAASLSYLAAAGVGHIGIIDDDAVELSNLNRQIIHEHGDIGRAKVESAADRLEELNPDITVTPHRQRFTASVAAMVADYDLVLDGSDNFETRYALNRATLDYGVAWVYAAVRGWDGQCSFFSGRRGPQHPCYRCLVPETPGARQDCQEQGVMAPLVGIMGSISAMEAIKWLSGCAPPYHGRVLLYQGLSGRWREVALYPDPACADCAPASGRNAGG